MTEVEFTTFFIDRCLGNKLIVETLRTAGVNVEIHVDRDSKVKVWKDNLDLLSELNDFLEQT
jgi:hypothetical protein